MSSTKPVIWIIDTSVFLNVLDVPQFNQERVTILQELKDRIKNEDTFLLPFASIIETGNHIAKINNGNQRRKFAQKFSEEVRKSLEGESPWRPLEFPKPEDVKQWLGDFPDSAQQEKGLADHLIINQW